MWPKRVDDYYKEKAMKDVNPPYQSKAQGYPPPRQEYIDVEVLRTTVKKQGEQLNIAKHNMEEMWDQSKMFKGEITGLKKVAREINVKYNTEMKRTRQLREDIVNANIHANNLFVQNEDIRERLMHIEKNGVTQHRVMTVKQQASNVEMMIALVGVVAIIVMVLAFLAAFMKAMV